MKRFWRDLTSHYRYAIYSAKSELKSEVANSYLNWIWWVLEPFCFMLIYAFIFGVVFEAREQYFPAFIFIGITAWDFFNRCLTPVSYTHLVAGEGELNRMRRFGDRS